MRSEAGRVLVFVWSALALVVIHAPLEVVLGAHLLGGRRGRGWPLLSELLDLCGERA